MNATLIDIPSDLDAARAIIDAQWEEIRSLQRDLREAHLLGEFTEQNPRLDWDRHRTYTLTRTFTKTFTDHSAGMHLLRVLRALLNPAAQGAPLIRNNGVH